ncbi:hypothetical protein D1AOALGA4SA_9551 [Olavius algarvensis Delta 1 endosymbiont]|nr:hypothetical protein D1AOALGA4SA_9551 [Olavius algarvensis Delta 1 endosymbiont]
MPKLRNRDVQKIIQLFDNQLLTLQRVSKIEKMKMRKKIVNVVQPALSSAAATPETFMLVVETKLVEITKHFLDSYGFQTRLGETVRNMYQKAAEAALPPPPKKKQ